MTCTELAREYGLHPSEVSTVVKADGIEPEMYGQAWILTARQLQRLRPKLERLRAAKNRRVAAEPAAV